MRRAGVPRWLPALAIAATATSLAAQPAQPSPQLNFGVAPDLWDRPRSGEAVLAQPAVRQAVDHYLKLPGSRLVVHHGPAQDSLLAAEELRAWLAALAVEPARVTLRGDLQGSESLVLEVIRE